MAARPPSSFGRPGSRGRGMPVGTAVGRPPGTASRLATAMRPGTRGGQAAGGMALSSQVMVTDRPMTQQGLGGLKTGAKGPQRQVQDKSYFLGLLRSKINELKQECGKMTKDIEEANSEATSFLSYEKKAESLAGEIKDLQGELGDYNTLNDKLNTDTDIRDVERDYDDLKSRNDMEERQLDSIFEEKKKKEQNIKQLEVELQQEKRMTDNMVQDMEPRLRDKYMSLKDQNEHMLKQLEKSQQELDSLNMKKDSLEEELSMSHIKQEAVRIYEQIHELEEKRQTLLEDQKSTESPQEERERLLNQVKQDNHEISTMERQTAEIKEEVIKLQEEIRAVEVDIEESNGERNQKYKELKKREETMNEFLERFEENKTMEVERLAQAEANVVAVLENTSRNMARTHNLPTPAELSTMKDDLSFKQHEMKNSEMTTTGLAREDEKLRMDLEKVEQLEQKVKSELTELDKKIETMNKEMVTYKNLDGQRHEAEQLKDKLTNEKVVLQKRAQNFKAAVMELSSQYEALKAQLSENETFTQLGNLERKWQHLEQNNFVMKEFIAGKGTESDYRPLSKKVESLVEQYNQVLIRGDPPRL